MKKSTMAILMAAIMVLGMTGASLAEGSPVRIVLGAQADQAKAEGAIKITEGGTYSITGTLKEGFIEVEADADVVLELDNASITNSAGPAIISRGGADVTIAAKAWTTNYLRNTLYGEDESSAVQVAGNLRFSGEGALYVNSVSSDGIDCGGNIDFACSDLRINAYLTGASAAGFIEVTDGYLHIICWEDGLRSGGQTIISGGKLISLAGTDAGERGIEAAGGLTVLNGTVMATGAGAVSVNEGNGQAVLSFKTDGITKAGEAFDIVRYGLQVVAFAPVKEYLSVLFSSDDLVAGEEYIVYVGGEHTGVNDDGYFGGGRFSAGVKGTVLDEVEAY